MIIALLNLTGGVGKTNMSMHRAGPLARKSRSVMRVEAYPQGSSLDKRLHRLQSTLLCLFGVLGLPWDHRRPAPDRHSLQSVQPRLVRSPLSRAGIDERTRRTGLANGHERRDKPVSEHSELVQTAGQHSPPVSGSKTKTGSPASEPKRGAGAEGKIKGRGTGVREKACLHEGKGGTRPPSRRAAAGPEAASVLGEGRVWSAGLVGDSLALRPLAALTASVFGHARVTEAVGQARLFQLSPTAGGNCNVPA